MRKNRRSWAQSAVPLMKCIAIALIGQSGTSFAQTRPGGAVMPAAAPAPALDRTTAVRSCESLAALRPSDHAVVREARTMPAGSGSGDWCRVTIDIAVPGERNVVTAWLALPIGHWNGRFLGVGGGGWVAGWPFALNQGVPLGFATVITNAGRPYDLSADVRKLSQDLRNDFLRDAEGRLDPQSLENFAHRSIHDMTVVGKAVATEFYGGLLENEWVKMRVSRG